MNKADSIAGIITVIGGVLIYWFANGYGLRGLNPDPLGPSVFPKMLGAGLAALGFLLILMNIRKKAKETNEKQSFFNRANIRILMMIGTGIFYIFAFELLGFLVTTILFIIAIMMITGERGWRKLGITSVAVSISLYFIFKELLNVLLPLGFGF